MPARGLFPLISYKTYHLLCSEWWALPHPATCPLSLRNQPLGSACALTSTLNCFHLLFCFSPSFSSSRLWTTAHESDSCFPRSSIIPTSPRDACLAGQGSRAVHPQGRAGQANSFSPQHRYLTAPFHFFIRTCFFPPSSISLQRTKVHYRHPLGTPSTTVREAGSETCYSSYYLLLLSASIFPGL